MATKIALTGTSTLGVTSDIPGAYKYQWFRNGAPVSGTQEKSLEVRNASVEDLKATYWVIVYGHNASEESNKLVLGALQPAPQPVDPKAAPAPAQPAVVRANVPTGVKP